MTASARNVWLELAACGLLLVSLSLFLLSGVPLAHFVVNALLPGAEPISLPYGLTYGRNEMLIAVVSVMLPGAALVAAAWGLRVLLAGEDEPDA